MAIKHISPPTASAFAKTARLLRLPLKGGVKFKSVRTTQNCFPGDFQRAILEKIRLPCANPY